MRAKMVQAKHAPSFFITSTTFPLHGRHCFHHFKCNFTSQLWTLPKLWKMSLTGVINGIHLKHHQLNMQNMLGKKFDPLTLSKLFYCPFRFWNFLSIIYISTYHVKYKFKGKLQELPWGFQLKHVPLGKWKLLWALYQSFSGKRCYLH